MSSGHLKGTPLKSKAWKSHGFSSWSIPSFHLFSLPFQHLTPSLWDLPTKDPAKAFQPGPQRNSRDLSAWGSSSLAQPSFLLSQHQSFLWRLQPQPLKLPKEREELRRSGFAGFVRWVVQTKHIPVAEVGVAAWLVNKDPNKPSVPTEFWLSVRAMYPRIQPGQAIIVPWDGRSREDSV